MTSDLFLIHKYCLYSQIFWWHINVTKARQIYIHEMFTVAALSTAGHRIRTPVKNKDPSVKPIDEKWMPNWQHDSVVIISLVASSSQNPSWRTKHFLPIDCRTERGSCKMADRTTVKRHTVQNKCFYCKY